MMAGASAGPILFASDHVHVPQGGGGGERNTHELCLALRARGVSAGVMAALVADGSWLSYRNRLARHLRPSVRFPRDTVAGYPVFRGWKENGVREVVARFRPRIVVVQGTDPQPFLRGLASIGCPAAVYIHEVAEIDHLRALAGQVPFLANSAFTAARLAERCGIQARVILPLVDPVFYRTEVTPKRVLFVNTVPRKGLETALAVAHARPDIAFDFVRSWIVRGEAHAELARRTAAAGNITLHDPTGDMRPLYATARVLLAPSQWEETWGRVVTEAHLNGVPVLASNTGGLPQSVGPGGITLPPDAPPEAWAAALSELWDNPANWQHYAQSARNYAARPDIQPDTIVRQFLAATDAIGPRRPVVRQA